MLHRVYTYGIHTVTSSLLKVYAEKKVCMCVCVCVCIYNKIYMYKLRVRAYRVLSRALKAKIFTPPSPDSF